MADNRIDITQRKIRNAKRKQLARDQAAMWRKLTYTAPTFESILMPHVRNVMPQTIAADIVGVQPMSSTAGQIFAMRHNYTGDNDSGE